MLLILGAIAVYLLLMLGVGIYYSKKNSTVDDFYLGGRKLGPLVTAMSAEASDMSSWLLMGLPGVAYLSGICDASWTAIGLAVGTYVNWLVVAKRIRVYSHRLGAITVPEFLSKRYHDDKNLLSCIAAVVIVVFFVPYTASGFAACGKLFTSLLGLDYLPTMIVCALVIVVYTAMGGFLAASVTDLIQSIVMTIALVVVLCFGVQQAGGMDAVLANAQAMPGYLAMTATHDAAANAASPYGAITIFSTLAWGLGYFGMPHILLRFMAIEDENKLKVSRRIATVWVVISMAVAVFIGVVGNGMTKVGAVAALEGSASDYYCAHCHPTEPVRPAACPDCGHHSGGHSGGYHVHGGQPAAGGLFQRVPESGAGLLRREAEQQGQPDGGPRHAGGHQRHRGVYRP